MKNILSYKIYTQPFDPDLLAGVVWEFEITGLLENEDHISIFTSDNNITLEEQLNSSLLKLKKENFLDSFRIEKEIIEDKNWNKIWENSREVIRVSDKIVVKPTFKHYSAKPGEIVLTIDPKMSFGTGEHQTTKLVLRLLEKYIRKGMKILDVGSGTGILAIASINLGASKAVAVDLDEICLDNCKENCVLNGVENSVEIITGEIDDVNEKDFDLILANIQKNVLLEIAATIKSNLKSGGVVILSGLLESDKISIEKKYHSLGFITEQVEKMDEWIAIVFSANKRGNPL